MIKRPYLIFAHDLFAVFLAFVASILLIHSENPYFNAFMILGYGAISVFIAAPLLFKSKLYRGVWRYASMREALSIVIIATLTVALLAIMLFFIQDIKHFSFTFFLINWFLLIGFLSGPRLVFRLMRDRSMLNVFKNNQAEPVLLLGVTNQAEIFVREMTRMVNAPYHVKGFVDFGFKHIGLHIHGTSVLGSIHQLSEIIQNIQNDQKITIKHVILADLDIPSHHIAQILAECEQLGTSLLRLPKMVDFEQGKKTIDVEPISLEDLLGRPQNSLDIQGLRDQVYGRTILVTGAGGSIGSEIVRQIAALRPSRLILIDHSEFLLYSIDLEMERSFESLDRMALLADVRDESRMRTIFENYKPDLVFHAAALKHVPIVEDQPIEGIQTNVMGTQIMADLCAEFFVKAMIMISTDKAVNPTNVMGATKRLAETYCQALDLTLQEKYQTKATRFITVRFGNVLGSNGSVVPLFKKQLEAGGPITVTHPEIKRYFMTIQEAVQLVLQAFSMGMHKAEDSGKIYVLDMGEPVKIVDLAKQMIRLAGLRPEKDIDIEFVGLRPGEKLFEELFHDSESLVATETTDVFLASPRSFDLKLLEQSLLKLNKMCHSQHTEEAIAKLKHLVPEYQEPEHHFIDKASSSRQ